MTPESTAAAFVLAQPVERVEELVARLSEGVVVPGMSQARLAQHVRLGADSLRPTVQLLHAWKDESDAGSRLARTLASQLEVAATIRAHEVRAELVWTGHRPAGSPLRTTVQVVNEMLDEADDEVIVLAYALWLGHAKAGSVLDRLVSLATKGRRVVFVVDRRYRTQNGPVNHNLAELKSRWPAGAPKPSVYSWDDGEDEIAKLHAKVLVVDANDLLVTSANLTGHGLSGNLELGTRTIGTPARRARDHVMDLIRTGFFRAESLW